MANYDAIVGAGATPAGVDQGIDFVPAGPGGFDILAPASGTITLADASGHHFNRTSGEALIILQLDQPPNVPNSSSFIYFAEIISLGPGIAVGAHVDKGAVIGHCNASPGIEVGWGRDATNGFLCDSGIPTPCGESFNNWVQGLPPGGGGGVGPPGGNSAGNQVQTFFNDDPSPINGGDMLGLTDPQNNLPLLWDRAKSPFITNLLHGSMKTVAPPHFAVYFMFNPQSVDYSYGFNATAIPIAYEDNSLQNNAQVLMNQTITFSLLFDRIYEVGYWDWSNNHGRATPNLNFQLDDVWGAPSGPHTDGVNWDIRAVERLVGIYDKTLTQPPAGTDPNNPGATPAPGQLISNAGVAMGNAVDVALGSRAAPVFRGYVGGLGVNYTRFNEKMVPVRAELQVTLIRLPIPHPEKIDVPTRYNPYVTTPTVY